LNNVTDVRSLVVANPTRDPNDVEDTSLSIWVYRPIRRVQLSLQSNDANLKAKYSQTGAFDTSKVSQLVTATEEMEKYRALIKEKARKVAGSV
jgi:hypothetical protein